MEIQAWMDSHSERCDRFVILDDDDDMAHLIPNLIQCNGGDGLTTDVADAVIETLMQEAFLETT